MSGNAALAAAKRRRNPALAGEAGRHLASQLEKVPRKVQSVPELLVEHDRKLFVLEKKFDETHLNEDNANTGASGSVANNAENLAKSNAIEIKLLKATVTKQGKALQDVHSLLTTVRATLNTQTAEINRLKSLREDVDALKKASVDVTEASDEVDDNVELKVSEK